MIALPFVWGMYSCSDDDNDNLIGKWEFIQSYGDVDAYPETLKNKINEYFYYVPRNSEVETLEFKNNGKGISTIIVYNGDIIIRELNYTINGNMLKITYNENLYGYDNEEIEYYGEFSFDNNGNLLIKEELKDDYENLILNYEGGKINKAILVSVFKKI